MDEKQQIVGGVVVPDTPVIARAIELARRHSDAFLFNHAMRSWLFAERVAQLQNAVHDAEVIAVGALLHDLGLTDSFPGPLRFEVEGANVARSFAREQGFAERRAQLVWDSVALNSTPSIALHKEPEVALCTIGIVIDFGGDQHGQMRPEEVAGIVTAFPRLKMKRQFTACICGLVRARPGTTYDNFARDFGERFVPGYKAPSTVDFLLNSPFPE